MPIKDGESQKQQQQPALSNSTHYQVLGITSSLLDAQQQQQQDPIPFLRRAYHRALLRNHPDKRLSKAQNAAEEASSDVQAVKSPFYTVDQITAAFETLSSKQRRAEYDNGLRLSRTVAEERDSSHGGFQTGIESVDLDDLHFDESANRWYRSCRCGNERGYILGETDLVAAADEAELLVGCQDCSLWLRVHFAVVLDD